MCLPYVRRNYINCLLRHRLHADFDTSMMLEDNLFASHAIAGVGSVALASSLTYPLDTIKVLKQVKSKASSTCLFIIMKWFATFLILWSVYFVVKKQVGSGSNKQLSSLQVLNRLGSLSGKCFALPFLSITALWATINFCYILNYCVKFLIFRERNPKCKHE